LFSVLVPYKTESQQKNIDIIPPLVERGLYSNHLVHPSDEDGPLLSISSIKLGLLKENDK
jgi:hypothetical protein